MARAVDDRPLFLVGFMGSGKSSVASALAATLGWEAVETDEIVERAAGRPIERIFRESGEATFRRLEGEALRSLDGRRASVVATGGGLYAAAAHRRWIAARGRSVWLDVPLEVCTRRVGSGAGRPLWDAADPVGLRALFERRRAAYALARMRVAAGDRDPAAVARLVAGRL